MKSRHTPAQSNAGLSGLNAAGGALKETSDAQQQRRNETHTHTNTHTHINAPHKQVC